MTKVELIRKIKETVDKVTLKDITLVLEATMEAIKDTVANGEKVTLSGFGSFEAKNRNARECRNPSTGETIQIESFKVPKFNAGKAFKDTVRNS